MERKKKIKKNKQNKKRMETTQIGRWLAIPGVLLTSTDGRTWGEKIRNVLSSQGRLTIYPTRMENLTPTIVSRGLILSLNAATSVATLEEALSPIRRPMPPRVDAFTHVFVFIAKFDMCPVVFVRDCGFVASEMATFGLDNLPPPPPPSPPPLHTEMGAIPPPTSAARSAALVGVFRLPVPCGVADVAGTITVKRALEVARMVALLVPTCSDDVVLPDAAMAEGWESVQPREWDAALAMLVVSLANARRTIDGLAEGYRELVTACCEADATFFARMVAHNPLYASCATPTMMALKSAQSIRTLADAARSIQGRRLPACVRYFAMLFDDGQYDDDDDDDDDS
jgi:hypothetical protein